MYLSGLWFDSQVYADFFERGDVWTLVQFGHNYTIKSNHIWLTKTKLRVLVNQETSSIP